MYDILTQAVGFIAAAFVIISFQYKENKKLFMLQIISSAVFALQFFMLGAYTGMIMNILGVVRCTVLFARPAKISTSKVTLAILVVLFIAMGVITWSGILSLLPIIGMVLSMFAMWSGNGKVIRLAQLFIVSPCWLIYNAFAPSFAGVLVEALNMVSVIISIKRFGIKNLDMVQ